MDNSNQNAVGLGLPKDDKNLKTVDNPNQAYWELAGGTWTEEQAARLDWERAFVPSGVRSLFSLGKLVPSP